MESPRERPPPNPPSTPRPDAEAAAVHEDKKPPRAQRRAREVSSRYLMAVASPSAPLPSSSLSSSSVGGAPALPPPPPRKPEAKQKRHHQALFLPATGVVASALTVSGDGNRDGARRSPSTQMRHPSSHDAVDSDGEGSWYGDENLSEAPPHAISRSLETPMSSGLPAKDMGTQRRRVVRLFKEIGGEPQHQPPLSERQRPQENFNSRVVDSRFLARKPRPGTPIVHLPERHAAAASGGTPSPRTADVQTLARPVNPRTASRRTTTPHVNRSLQETLAGIGQPPVAPGTSLPQPSDREFSGRSVETSPEKFTAADFSEEETCSISSPGGLCDSPPIGNQNSRARISAECRSSMPEADLLPAMSSRLMSEGNLSQLDGVASSTPLHRALSSSLCHRSLNSALSSCQQRQLNPTMSISRLSSLRSPSNSARGETFALPQQPTTGKLSLDSRKGRKVSSRQEDAHTLRLLENRYLQWRFLNARAQSAKRARNAAAERSLCGVSCKLSDLHGSVALKRIELDKLKRVASVSNILEAQMSLLEEWVSLEDDYSQSLYGAIKSLKDASLRLPISGNVRADIRELAGALDSATNVLDVLAPRVGSVEAQADGTQTVLSDLAKVVSEERVLLEQFGELFVEADKLQVYECSLRSHLVQIKRANCA